MKSFKDFLLTEARPDPRAYGKMGRFLIDDGMSVPDKGDHLDYFDSNGDKQYGTVTSVSNGKISIKDSVTKKVVKLDMVKP